MAMKVIITLFSITIFIFNPTKANIFDPKSVLKNVKLKVFNIIDSSINGTDCAKDLKRFITDLPKLKQWTTKMFDASNKLHPGLLHGNIQLQGSYDQCLSVRKEMKGREILGQYCTMRFIFTENSTKTFLNKLNTFRKELNAKRLVDWKFFKSMFKLYYGLCIPKSCSVKNLNNLETHLVKALQIPFQAQFSEELCHYKSKPVDSNRIDIYVLFLLFVVLNVELASTGYDLYLNKTGRKPNMFVTLSLYTNLKNLLSPDDQKRTLTCLDGIKTISMMWVILGHVASTKLLAPNINTSSVVTEWTGHIGNTLFLGAPYAVDTFFTISGLLTVYVNSGRFKRWEKEKIDWFSFYSQRFCRLMPALLATILINVSIVKYFINGPFSFIALKMLKTNCEKSWWTTLVFANNVVNLSDQCLPHTWYLAADTHLHIFSPLLLLGLKRSPTKTFLAVLAVCNLSFIYTWTLVIIKNIGFIPFWEVRDDTAADVYLSTIGRMPPWLIGTCLGYLIYRQKIEKFKISRKVNLFLFTLSLYAMLNLILLQSGFNKEEYNVYRSAFFNTFSRSLWSVSLCYIIFSCCTGRGGFVNVFLSLPVFSVVGKMAYSVYLIHVTTVFIVTFNRKEAGYFSSFEIVSSVYIFSENIAVSFGICLLSLMFCEFWTTFFITLVCGAVLCLLFEMPIVSFWEQQNNRKNKKDL